MRPRTHKEYLDMIRAWGMSRTKQRNGTYNEETFKRSLYVFLLDGMPELFTSESTNMDFVQKATALMQDAPESYYSHGLKSYVIPFAWWCGIIDADTMLRWKRLVPNYRAAVHVIDRTPSTKDVVSFFTDLRTRHDANDFWSCCYDAIACTLLLTGARRQQIVSLVAGQDVHVAFDEAGDTVRFKFIPYKDYSRNRHMVVVPLSTSLPGGGTYGDYLYDWIDARPRVAESFFCRPDGTPLNPRMIYDFIRTRFHQSTGTAYTPHAMRSFTVSLVANTQSVEQAQHLVGHRHLSTTMKYHNPYANGSQSAAIITRAMNTLGEQP